MTEAEWRECLVPEQVWQAADQRTSLSARKRLLFACACVRRIWTLLPGPSYRDLVECGEQSADGLVSEEVRLERFHEAVSHYRLRSTSIPETNQSACVATLRLCSDVWSDDGAGWSTVLRMVRQARELGLRDAEESHSPVLHSRELEAEYRAQAAYARDIAGNPFRAASVRLPIASPIRALANAAYEERELPPGLLDTGRLGVLADALEETDAANGEVLEHLRSPGPHVRGCWAVDVVLGRS